MPKRSKTGLISKTKMAMVRLSVILCFAILSSCNPETNLPSPPTDFDLTIRLGFEPDRLNPILSRQVNATQIEGMVFLPLADYNPFNLQLEPILIKSNPKISRIDDGTLGGTTKYEMEILDEATWDDGKPITAADYVFTMKAGLNPYLINTTWKGQIEHIADIILDPQNPRKITVLTDIHYILSEEVITTNDIYPEHIYDSLHLLQPYSFSQLKNHRSESNGQIDSILHQFADQFNDEKYSRMIISGAGPYSFVEWIPNQQIVLKRKTNWWGTPFQDRHPCLQAKPTSITYYIIPETQTALTSLKDRKIDLVADLSPEHYAELQQFNAQRKSLVLESPSVLQYYFIALNNDRPALRDPLVRNALARLMDIQSLIDQLFFGLATRTTGPISPQHEAYDQDLKPIAFDPEGALRLLSQSGWSDTNQDQVLDKMIDGQRHDLRFEILTTKMQLSQDVAIILKEEADKIGIKMEIIPNDLPKLIQEVRTGNYDLACLASVQSVGPYDPFNYWHSSNTGPNGTNSFKFRNAEADRLIEKIRQTLDSKERNVLYKEFQKILYNEQPAIFLVAPKTLIAASAHLTFNPTTLRPGYFENTIDLKN